MTNKKEIAVKVGEKTCFVIMPISNQPGYESNHFTLVYEDIIRPAIEAAGMRPVRADETVNTNLIQLDILRKVIESDIAICDMSSKNPNVFYELGVRQAFDKPTVLMIDDATSAPFDVSSLRYVDYKKNMGFRDVNIAVEKLTQTLVETYEKRDDKSEINSLIRLMELTTPAQLSQVTLSAEDRTAVQISELSAAMHNMQATQSKILTSLNKAVSFEKESAAIHPTNSLAGLKRAWEESDKRRYKLSFESPE
ncbi:hypothetical protein F0262_25220 [Vibrio rotiferianus]|uniref:Uncharacterized protein n=2 Tax=Vibrio harveyi group TaxID=717610 RepID=A0A7Y3ZDX1_9VIBR|nr:hypothetical protein [Vibrio rotiferianus]NOH51288.1 hypothetical protein [Vibrio rotiferianus]